MKFQPRDIGRIGTSFEYALEEGLQIGLNQLYRFNSNIEK